MKYIKIKSIAILVGLLGINACQMDLEPYDSKSDATALTTPADLQMATYGSYSGLKTLQYQRELFWLMIYPSDNVALSGTTSNSLYNAYTYTHFPGMANTTGFWRDAYKAIYSANRIIEEIADGESPELDQLKGENLFLRSLSHFFLVRLFGRPYTQGDGNNPGIPIKNNTLTEEYPARSSVKEVYDFMIADLVKAADLMTEEKSASYATKEAAFALLSRIYLYMDDNENAILYANKVIDSDRFQLVDTETFKTYFIPVPENNPETIFAIRNIIADDMAKSAIGNQFYNDPVTQATGYGESYVSMELIKLMNQYPEDARHSFVEIQLEANGDTLKRGNVPKFFMNKFNWQDGVANLSSPVILRLAEMYLNRAEANAKLGNMQLAIDDVNLIRQRAGLSGDALYSVDDLKWHESVLDVVLEERRLEFFFEGHRVYDLFRNNLPMTRRYIGFHGTDHFNFSVPPEDDRVVFFIPEYEIINNPNLVQNP